MSGAFIGSPISAVQVRARLESLEVGKLSRQKADTGCLIRKESINYSPKVKSHFPETECQDLKNMCRIYPASTSEIFGLTSNRLTVQHRKGLVIQRKSRFLFWSESLVPAATRMTLSLMRSAVAARRWLPHRNRNANGSALIFRPRLAGSWRSG